eukprot:1048623-Prorocentrum_lima.AAC.1
MIQYLLRDLSGRRFRWCGRVRSIVGRIFLMCVRVVWCCRSGSCGVVVVELMSLKSASTSGSAEMSVPNVGVVRSVVVARPVSPFLRSRRILCII